MQQLENNDNKDDKELDNIQKHIKDITLQENK